MGDYAWHNFLSGYRELLLKFKLKNNISEPNNAPLENFLPCISTANDVILTPAVITLSKFNPCNRFMKVYVWPDGCRAPNTDLEIHMRQENKNKKSVKQNLQVKMKMHHKIGVDSDSV